MRRLVLVFMIGTAWMPSLAAQRGRTPAPPVPATPAVASLDQQAPQAPQTPAPTPAAPTAPATPVPQGRGRGAAPPAVATAMMARKTPSQNVRMDVTITDTFGTGPTKKTVTMLVADTRTGSIRASMQIPVSVGPPGPEGAGIPAVQSYSYSNISLNVDATPEVLPDGRVYVSMSVQYTPDTAQAIGGARKPGSLTESLTVVLQDGKPTLISQSADPQGDRHVTLEVTANVVK
jgi:hypothetical protein